MNKNRLLLNTACLHLSAVSIECCLFHSYPDKQQTRINSINAASGPQVKVPWPTELLRSSSDSSRELWVLWAPTLRTHSKCLSGGLLFPPALVQNILHPRSTCFRLPCPCPPPIFNHPSNKQINILHFDTRTPQSLHHPTHHRKDLSRYFSNPPTIILRLFTRRRDFVIDRRHVVPRLAQRQRRRLQKLVRAGHLQVLPRVLQYALSEGG